MTFESQPVVKVGGVLLRKQGGAYEVLIIQPRPKNEGYNTAMGFVRGTRKYQNAQGDWIDANRDGVAQPEHVKWEPVTHTLMAELHEEAGLAPEQLARQSVYEIGPRNFASQRRLKDIYVIHWFAVVLDDAAQASLPYTARAEHTDAIEPGYLYDSLFSKWVTVAEFKQLASVPYELDSEDRVHPEYVQIAEEAIAGIDAGILTRVDPVR